MLDIVVAAIIFSHAGKVSPDSALPIRMNQDTPVATPEYEWNMTTGNTLVRSLPVCYSITDHDQQPLRIRCSFYSEQLRLKKRWVRAVSKDASGQPHYNVLGEVAKKEITFGLNGYSIGETPGEPYVWMDLEGSELADRGVCSTETKWQWHWSERPDGPWENFPSAVFGQQPTTHRTYVVLTSNYGESWSSNAGASNLPWAEALQHACDWADGARTTGEVRQRITTSIHYLGFRRECPLFYYNDSQYAPSDRINLGLLLARLDGRPGMGPCADCSDCSAMVSVFSSLLGAPLQQAKISGPFNMNPVQGIGQLRWGSPLDSGRRFFKHHKVAVDPEELKSAPSRAVRIYDACLKLDADSDPTDASHVDPVIPAGLNYGEYLRMLLAPYPTGNPSVSMPAATLKAIKPYSKLHTTLTYGNDEPIVPPGAESIGPENTVFIGGVRSLPGLIEGLEGFNPVWLDAVDLDNGGYVVTAVWSTAADTPCQSCKENTITVQLTFLPSEEEAESALLQFLDQFEIMAEPEPAGLWDFIIDHMPPEGGTWSEQFGNVLIVATQCPPPKCPPPGSGGSTLTPPNISWLDDLHYDPAQLFMIWAVARFGLGPGAAPDPQELAPPSLAPMPPPFSGDVNITDPFMVGEVANSLLGDGNDQRWYKLIYPKDTLSVTEVPALLNRRSRAKQPLAGRSAAQSSLGQSRPVDDSMGLLLPGAKRLVVAPLPGHTGAPVQARLLIYEGHQPVYERYLSFTHFGPPLVPPVVGDLPLTPPGDDG